MLGDLEQAMLDLERQWFVRAGGKEQAIADRTSLTTTAYYQQLNQLIDTRAALEHDPVTVNRLRRLRDERARRRAA